MTMIDVIKDNSIQQWIDGFVDDTSLFSNIIQQTDNNNIIQLCKQLTIDMTIWNELLEASGGKLELSKCFYYVLSWKFDADGNGIPMTIPEQQAVKVDPIKITADKKDSVTILQKEVNQAHKTLGCYKAIDGNEEEQIKFLTNKSRQFGRKLYNKSLTRKQANMAYKAIYIPSMRYGLPACSISCANIEIIQKSTLDKFLPFMGYEHGSPRALIHGPLEMGGCEIPHLYTEMLGLKIESIISHIRADSILGKSFRININYLQLLSGLEQPIFSTRDNIGYITNNWLIHLRNFLLEINGALHIKDLWQPTKLRQHDIVLMSEFVSLGFNTAELRLINNWRLYFRVTTLAELCNPEGTRIRECFLKEPTSEYVNEINPSALQWPNQGKPSKRGFKLWLKCLSSCFNVYRGRINHKFGAWKDSAVLIKNNLWKHFIQSSSGSLFTRSKDSFYYIPAESRTKTTATYKNDRSHCCRTPHLPADCIPISLRLNRQRNTLIAKFSPIMQPARIITKDSLHWTTPFTENTIVTDDITFRRLFSQDEFTIYITSDGGVHNYEGTFGVILSDGLSSFAQNHGKLFSVDFCESSYRSELFAMLSGILSFKSLCETASLKPGTKILLKLVSDSKILINKINKRLHNRRTTNQHRDSDVDLELQLIHELKILASNNCQIFTAFVRSHQELKKVKTELSHIETMNIMADTLTKQARKLKRKATYTSLPKNPIDFTINDIIINSKYSLRSKKAYHSINLRAYLQEKHAWSNQIIESIWWKPYHNSISKLSSPEKTIIYKFINDRLPTNARDNKYYPFREKHCFRCQSDIENEDHILKCLSIKRKQSRIEWISEISHYLSQNHTPPAVKDIILQNLQQWLEPSNIIDITSEINHPELHKAAFQQQRIGWRHFIRGRLSIAWGTTINHHFTNNKIPHITAENWAAGLLHINWRHILKIWRERCLEMHGNNPEEIEQKTKERYLIDIQHIQSINQNVSNSQHDWILDDIDELRLSSSKNLQTWLYGAKIISRNNQLNIKQQQRLHRNNSLWQSTKFKPPDEPITKSDLDPGE
jgi:ribonuclease HI